MAKVIGYTRVSTDEQVANGVSLDAQAAKIRKWADLNEDTYSDVVIYTDEGLSGTIHPTKRPGLQTAISSLSRGDCLVVYSLSRLSRCRDDIFALSSMLAKKKVALVSMSEKIDTTTAVGNMFFGLMAILAQFERDQISERTSDALQHKKQQGLVYGSNTPYGYRAVDGRLVEDSKEQEVITNVKDLYHRKGYNYSKLAMCLNAHDIPTRCGGVWTAQQVKNVLTN